MERIGLPGQAACQGELVEESPAEWKKIPTSYVFTLYVTTNPLLLYTNYLSKYWHCNM